MRDDSRHPSPLAIPSSNKESKMSSLDKNGYVSTPAIQKLTQTNSLSNLQRDDDWINTPSLTGSEINEVDNDSIHNETEERTTHWSNNYDNVCCNNWSTRNNRTTPMAINDETQCCVENRNSIEADAIRLKNKLENDDTSPMTIASKRRIALLKKHKSKSKRSIGPVTIATRTLLKIICEIFLMLRISTRNKRLYNLQTDSHETEHTCRISYNPLYKRDILRTYFKAVITNVYLMILKPLYNFTLPQCLGLNLANQNAVQKIL
mmetsp:Transcript_6070/g.7055  ORF Transcript_6070/g.7055 Transcript_6070/m.7055 type:complete len:263 (+) Transcript_6070:85-873(+)